MSGQYLSRRTKRVEGVLHLTRQKRIRQPLLTKTRAGAVAADEADIVAERQQLVLDRRDQRGVAAAWQVGAADRAIEQHVADMGKAHLPVEIDHAARRMAGAMQDIEGERADLNLFAFLQPAVGREVA